ncbi:hypothetical protein ACROYT_G000487 [Oculina patagonica]
MVAHSEILLSKCAQFRDEGKFIDVRLQVSEDVFPAHRIVLAANSDYFHAMFTDGMKESNQEVIELKDESISPSNFKIVMDSIYTGDLQVNEENVFEVLAAADHLQVTSVVQQCCDFLKKEFVQHRLDLHNYCLLCTVADRHGLRDLQEAAEHEIASKYKDVCESGEFLTNVGADQLFSLLSRDNLSAPSETFVFKSVMQWIKHKKEERMAVAAKVLGTVRLGLVDIRVVIEELDTVEMQRDQEIHMLVYRALIYNNMPSRNFFFASEKAKPRSMNPIPVAILPNTQMQYLDVVTKTWKPLPSMAQANDQNQACFCAEYVGNYLYVAAQNQSNHFVIYRYDIVNDSWDILPPFLKSNHQIDCLCSVDDYIYAISESNPPQRYSLTNNNWQNCEGNLSFLERIATHDQQYRASGGNFSFSKPSSSNEHKLSTVSAAVLKSKIYVIHGYIRYEHNGRKICWVTKPAVVHCFDPTKNKWEQKASTCKPHFGSSLFVVKNKLCVAGGKMSVDGLNNLRGDPAPVEVYNEENNTWSVVEQKHIPPNNLGAVEIEGRVYFIINKFPIDSGIRITPEEIDTGTRINTGIRFDTGISFPLSFGGSLKKTCHVSLNEWENLGKVSSGTVLSYLPVKRRP